MASYELNDLWWLKPPPKMVEAVDGMRLGMAMRQQAFDNQMQVKKLDLMAQQQSVAHVRDSLMLKQYQDQMADQPILMEYAQNPDRPLPTNLRSPDSILSAERIQQMWKHSEAGRSVAKAADEYFDKLKDLNAKDRIEVGSMMSAVGGKITPEIANKIDLYYERRPPKEFAAMAEVNEIGRLRQQAAGLPAGAERADLERKAALLEAKFLGPQERIEVNPDGTVSIQKGGSPVSLATGSQIQQRLIANEKAIGVGLSAAAKISPASLGVAGTVNQIIVNEGLAQIFPELKRDDVAEARAVLGLFNERVIKAVASDPRISDRDVKRLERILPKLGPLESVASANTKIANFMRQMREDARVDSKAGGLPTPDWALTPQEIQQKVQSGEWPRDKAATVLRQYFTNEELSGALK